MDGDSLNTTPRKTYKVGSIAIDSDGTWWVYFLGEHVSQGGFYFGPGNRGSKSLADLFKIVRMNLNKNKKLYLEQIANIEEAKTE